MSDEKAVIAWDKLGILQALELAQLEDESGEIQLLLKMLDAGVAKAEHYARLLELRSPERQRAKINEQMGIMAKYVVSVPRAWLLTGAPEAIDWSKAESYQWIKTAKFRELYQALMFGGMSGVDISKN